MQIRQEDRQVTQLMDQTMSGKAMAFITLVYTTKLTS